MEEGNGHYDVLQNSQDGNGKKKIRKKPLIDWQYFEFDYEELQETLALQLTSQDAIDFKVIHILIKMDVSR